MNKACELCGGACCKSFTIPFMALKGDAGDWLAYHGKLEGESVRFECACTKLKEGRCTIYQKRPKVCVDYKVGSPSCRAAIHKYNPEKEAQILQLITSAQKPSPMQE